MIIREPPYADEPRLHTARIFQDYAERKAEEVRCIRATTSSRPYSVPC